MTRRRSRPGENPETGIMAACLDLLHAHPQIVCPMRTNAGLAWAGKTQTHPTLGRILTEIHPVRLTPKGTQDLTAAIRGAGQFLAVEVKSEDGELSEEQERHLHELVTAGVRVLVVRSAGELADDLHNIFVGGR